VMRELSWTEAEKKLSRRAFEVTLQAELAEVLQDFKARAAAAQTPECVFHAIVNRVSTGW